MGKDTKKDQKKGGNSKNGKVPELEDFFTCFLAKKVRNINKRLGHIKELEHTKYDELKKDQQEMVSKKGELLTAIEENNQIKNLYLEAYSKKGEYEASGQIQQDGGKPEVVEKEDNSAQLAEVAKEAENKTINRVTEALSKLLVVCELLKTEANCEQFSHDSGLKSSDLTNLVDFSGQLWNKKANNSEWQLLVQRKFQDYVEKVAVRGTNSKSIAELANMTEDVVKSSAFSSFLPKAPVVVVKAEEKNVVVHTQPKAKEVKPASRKDSEVKMTRSRKESEAQQELFMEDDSDEEHEVKSPVAKPQQKVVALDEHKPSPKKEHKKEHKQKKERDDDEDEWHVAAKGIKPEGGPNPNYRGNNRGRGGYRGRGGHRGGFKQDGEKREWKEGDGERKEYDGEKRPYVKREYDGEKRQFDGEKRQFDGEKRPYTRGDGERGRGERGRGGRGRGGRGRGEGRGGYNKDGERKPYDGERKPYDGERRNFEPRGEKTNTEGHHTENAPVLKEVGTLDRPQTTANAGPVA